MPIEVSCAVKLREAELDLAHKQQLHYRITTVGDVLYVLRDHERAPMLSGRGAGIAQREWPTSTADVPKENMFVHGIGVRIFGNGSLRWEVEVRDADGAVLTVAKDCTYSNDSDMSTRLDLVHIVTSGADR